VTAALLRDIWANPPAQGQEPVYPAAQQPSDLLMMPGRDLLLEEGIRADMCDSVSGDSVRAVQEMMLCVEPVSWADWCPSTLASSNHMCR